MATWWKLAIKWRDEPICHEGMDLRGYTAENQKFESSQHSSPRDTPV